MIKTRIMRMLAGLTLLAMVTTGCGTITGAAVGAGVVVSGILSPILWGIYVVVQCLGGAAAGLAFRLLNPDDVAPEIPAESPAQASVPAPRGALADEVLSKQPIS